MKAITKRQKARYIYLSGWQVAVSHELPKGQTPWYNALCACMMPQCNALWPNALSAMHYGSMYYGAKLESTKCKALWSNALSAKHYVAMHYRRIHYGQVIAERRVVNQQGDASVVP
jgi:hypothetical protein